MLGPNDLMLRDYAQILVEERLREAESIRLSRLIERPHDRFFCRFVVRLGVWLVELGIRLQAQHGVNGVNSPNGAYPTP